MGTTIECGDDRAQTTQDFAIGISIFLLTVGFTFGFLPSLLTPFGSPLGDDITAKSDRVAATLIEENHVDGEPRTLNYTQLESFLASTNNESALQDHFGLRSTADVNITIVNVYDNGTREVLADGSGNLTAGTDYEGQTPAASTSRVVVLTGDRCDVQCFVVVKVW
ncbi:DUF7287 family protein [Haloarchaeobius amylolyticus]|uniref:DUF7287 family protein n=1 Tax=Haloarchaeobius amylolyticus TaxID=1198296 RepID=UPI002270184B|nr:hypothetical protein [Haloarchaeobius amylolyticus]